ncbi:phosphoenolpyruvate--protein phosphotransferase [Polyangium sorediatum]|uniref:Phosphoenolpyruvate-protein phosphotransferase n=1 Tax=Polyangium sorediatum TaxID=889274 RepID=A0ABT6NXE0_9BACT|nr:phosphoenolpyruvate--protein phosphotransferase [Polyangium sorediatum]MDI1432797.1 phosphoenolpyruvate--protein phosphotransferase [Polyangium sorediatum]
MSVEPPSKATEVLRGIAGSPGVAIGKVVVFGQSRAHCPRRTIGPGEIDAEVARFEEAVARAQRDLREMSQRLTERSAEASILEAYVLMTGDPVLAEAVRHQIQKEKRAAEWAVAEASDVIAKRLAALDDPYLSERSHDVLFIGDRILRAFGTSVPEQQNLRLDGPSIVVAHDLSPADTAAMINQPVVGFVTEVGTRTSHTAIMARALEIPAVVGVTDALKRISGGDLVVVDGLRGSVLVGPQPRELDEARARGERHTALSRELSVSRDREATTQDGVRVTLRANVELPAEAILARDHGAEGIGLYRTEFLYIDRSLPPTEDQQFEIFRAVVETMRPMPVTLRTFDIGGDKFISSLKLPPEMNPMLGLRAVRLALSQPEVFLEHLRAMVRASAYGEVKIMIPMIASLSELRQVRVLLEQAIEQVKARGLPCADEIPLGIMVEVPAAAVLVDLFAQEASFMSLGTNDLVQYTLAVDRTSRSLAYLASSFDPAILRLIRSVVRAGEGWSCPVSICGAMASDPLAAVLLVGLGMRDFSMEAAAIPEIKEALRRVTLVEAEAVAREALRFGTSDEVEHCVAEAFAPRLYDLLTGER